MKHLSVWRMFATKEQIEAEDVHQEQTKQMFQSIIPRLRTCPVCEQHSECKPGCGWFKRLESGMPEGDTIRYRAYGGAGKIPTDCCDFAVVDERTRKEVCRVWDEDMARKIALLLDAESEPQT